MNIKSLFAIAGIAALSVSSVFAQEKEASESYWFGGVKGGIQWVPTNAKFTDLLAPAAGINVGYMFAPQFGMRLDAQGAWSKTMYKSVEQGINFNYIDLNYDLLFNVTAMLFGHENPIDLILVGGAGWNYSWNTDRAEAYPYADRMIDSHAALGSLNMRAGAIADYKINKKWGVNLEVDGNYLFDDFNTKGNCTGDWQLTAMVGVAYKWGHKGGKKVAAVAKEEPAPAPAPAPVVKEEPAPAPTPVVKEEPAPAPAPAVVYKAPEEVNIELFYDRGDATISASEDAKLRGLSNFVKEHEVGSVVVSGYADKGTGNAEINQRLSEERANKVAKILKEKYNIPASRITTKAYGDTVQPYGENDKNRAVVIEVKEAK